MLAQIMMVTPSHKTNRPHTHSTGELHGEECSPDASTSSLLNSSNLQAGSDSTPLPLSVYLPQRKHSVTGLYSCMRFLTETRSSGENITTGYLEAHTHIYIHTHIHTLTSTPHLPEKFLETSIVVRMAP